MIEVAQYDEDSSTFSSQGILNGYFNIFKCDVCGTGSSRIAGLDGFGFNAFTTLDENNGEPICCLASNCEAVSC